ncbi:MAG: tunicamycin resistance protein [Micrococcaceae bacterium]
MIVWVNGTFGVGKTTCVFELSKRLSEAYVFDPELIGHAFKKGAPKEFPEDYQDYPLWRETVYQHLKHLSTFDSPILVPMTIYKPESYQDIILRLKNDGVELHHFILDASKATVNSRLLKRFDFGKTWARKKLPEVMQVFQHDIKGTKIRVDNLSPEQTANVIIDKIKLEKKPDYRPAPVRAIQRYANSVKHIHR